MFFNLLLARAETELQIARQAAEPSTPRAQLFLALALFVVDLFETHSDMTAFHLSVSLSPEDSVEGPERVIKLRHAISVSTPGCVVLDDDESKIAFALNKLPLWLMGDGELVLHVGHPLVEAVRVPDDNSDERHARAFRLALHIDACFQPLRVGNFVELVG